MKKYIVRFHSVTDRDATGLLIENRVVASETVNAESKEHARKLIAERFRGTEREGMRIKSIT